MTALTAAQASSPELLCHYLRGCPNHFAGAILIPGPDGWRDVTQLYPKLASLSKG